MTLGPLQTQWVAALRSGDYAQGRDYLNLRGNFCCLGVACDLFMKEGSETRPSGVVVYGLDSTCCAPKLIVDTLGLHGDLGETTGGKALAGMNDDGRTFDEIADFIEANPTLVFTGAF